MTDRARLIETAFPLEQTSIDSVHEKNVRHGHISTLHIWPARRPLAACRAALIATLLPDPGTPEARKALCERIGGRLVHVDRAKSGARGGARETRRVGETVGGVLHWGRERDNAAELQALRDEIRAAYGGRAPRVLDPFAGGGAIPLEAMRLGCEVTAVDLNPVAWFLLKCTLEYPQRFAGKKERLPEFALRDRDFMADFFEAQGLKKAAIRTFLSDLGLVADDPSPPLPGFVGSHVDPAFLEADLAWHVRAWGRRVLALGRKALASRYPVYADFQPLHDPDGWRSKHARDVVLPRRIRADEDGVSSVAVWNEDVVKRARGAAWKAADAGRRAEMVAAYLAETGNPRWVAKPTVAYLWARTVPCRGCRATIPLLKTRWLAKKAGKRVLLEMEPNAEKTGVVFNVRANVPAAGGNNAIRREHDRKLGQGTMSRGGAGCPCCGKPGTVAMKMEDIRASASDPRVGLGAVMTAVVVDSPDGKEYRLPTADELAAAEVSEAELEEAFRDVPFGIPVEPTPSKEAPGIRIPLYGFTKWCDIFSPRQLLAMATIGALTRQLVISPDDGESFAGACRAYLALMADRLANQSCELARWNLGGENIEGVFARFALPMLWDFAEVNPLSGASGAFASAVEWVSLALSHVLEAAAPAALPSVLNKSAIERPLASSYDLIVTDPPYYGAIPYSDLMDFFYIWLRRTVGDAPAFAQAFKAPLAPKWDANANDGELIDDASRHGNDAEKSKRTYEDGMARAFASCSVALRPEGRLVIVFANKQPDAWETLVSAIIRAGFAVDGSWPIRTERSARVRSLGSAALASSVWLVCKKRPVTTRAGWDRDVMKDMRARIHEQLRAFWDAGIRGPDFVWAATGPALEAYSRFPAVKKADRPNELMSVAEFLRAVRRIVVDFVVGRVLSRDGNGAGAPSGSASGEESGLDDVTTYYLLHRHDFHLEDAPAGACILYALSCNLSESDLADRFDVLVRTGGRDAGKSDEDDEEEDADAEPDEGEDEGSGSAFRLKSWRQRLRPGLGIDPGAEAARARRREEEMQPRLLDIATPAPAPRAIPLVDEVHHLMHLWEAGDLAKVDGYIHDRGLRRNALFQKLLQALLELSPDGSDERRLLEVVMNHFRDLGVAAPQTVTLPFPEEGGSAPAPGA